MVDPSDGQVFREVCEERSPKRHSRESGNPGGGLFNGRQRYDRREREGHGMQGKGCVVIVICLLTTSNVFARTVTVGHGGQLEEHSITSALAASATGDTILVASGVYNVTSGETFPLVLRNGISLVGDNVGSKPEICGDVAHSVILCESVEDVLLSRLRITDGSAETGGGLCVLSSSVEVEDCSIMNNLARAGGGVFVRDSTVTLRSCMLKENRALAYYGFGGGLHLRRSRADIEVCVFTSNHAEGGGGGMSVLGGETEVRMCRVEKNYGYDGGGIICEPVDIEIGDCTILGNHASVNGGISLSAGSASIRDSTINGNRALAAGGLGIFQGSAALRNCLISENEASQYGGIKCSLGSATLTNCTISGNRTEEGPGVHFAFAHLRGTNCVFWNDASDEIALSFFASVDISYSDIKEGWEGVGNIQADPLFVDAAGGDFRLQLDSSCIDSASISGPETDILGNPRPIDIPGVGRDDTCDAYDMGAYEYVEGGSPPCTPTPTPDASLSATMNPRSDINEDHRVDARDLLILLSDWKKETGPQ
jgi:uncharacterized protein DUF1565